MHVLGDGSRMYRPLTFRENLAARVEDFNTLQDARSRKRTLQDRVRLFDTYLDTCSSVAYKAGSNLFTIISQDKESITLPKNFAGPFLQVHYPAHAVNLDSSKGKYNCALTQQQVLDHDAWFMAVEGDRVLLREAARITFTEIKRRRGRETGMGFYVERNPAIDLRRALFVSYLGSNSGASGYDLSYDGSFLRVAPSQKGQSPFAQKGKLSLLAPRAKKR